MLKKTHVQYGYGILKPRQSIVSGIATITRRKTYEVAECQ